jgi:hypothetical protein
MAPNPLLQGQMHKFKGTTFKKRSYDDSWIKYTLEDTLHSVPTFAHV